MDRELYRILDLDFRICKRNKNFRLSQEFIVLHNHFVATLDRKRYFTLTPRIRVKRFDQLLLNLQYNNLLHGYNVYSYEDYCRYTEEFLTYMLNYELTTGNGNADFPENIQQIFAILNRYFDKAVVSTK